MGKRPKGYTLDRINSNDNYTVSNTRWTTIEEQRINRRRFGIRKYKGVCPHGKKWKSEIRFKKKNYYLGLLDDLVKEPWENPSIGIILCTDKKNIDVEYALRDINKPVGVSEYKLLKNLPNELSGKLPDANKLKEEILNELGN